MNRTTLAIVFGLVAVLGSGPAGATAQQHDQIAALVGLARVKRDGGDVAAARRHFEEARARGPLPATVLAEYLWLMPADDAAGILAVGREILQSIPAMGPVRDRTIAAAIAMKREPEVIDLAEGGRRVDPTSSLWPRRLAESYLRQGRPAEAAIAYGVASGLTGADQGDRIGQAVAFEAAGQAADAVAIWTTVPRDAWAGRHDWAASRLRALAAAGPADQAAAELAEWLQVDPSDQDVRALLVEHHARRRRPELALRFIGPLVTGPSGDAWARREVDLAVAAGQHARAIARLENIVGRRRGPSDDHWRLADLLLAANRHDAGRALVERLATPESGCTDRLFNLVERLPEPAATDLILALVRQQQCSEGSRWSTRAIERAVAASRHTEALASIEAWPGTGELRRRLIGLEGQLRLWTGQPSRAIPLLESGLRARPDDIAVRVSLVEALRATGQPDAAWTAAEPLLASGPATDNALPPADTLGPERLLMLAEVALEAGRFDRVRPILDRSPRTTGPAEAGHSGVAGPAEAGRSGGPDYETARAMLVGRALAARGEFAEAQRILQRVPAEALTPAARQALLESTRVVSVRNARTLQADGRTSEALALLEPLALAGDDALLRAELILTVRGPEQGAAALGRIAMDATAGPHVWLAWAAVASSSDRPGILERANQRFQNNPDILRVLGRTQWTAGRADDARATADATLALVPRDEDAWFVLVDATAATRPRSELDAVLDRFEPGVTDSPALAIRMAERLTGLAGAPDDALLTRAGRWLDIVAADEALVTPRLLARARVHAAGERWRAALDDLDALLHRDPAIVEALRLRADVMAWAGRHADALIAYDRYFQIMPGDVAARRQQARVAGWAGRYAEARRLYETLRADVPELAALSAEYSAKTAFFAGRWEEARRAYERWLAIEPESADANFELAETLRALGRDGDANARLQVLSPTSRLAGDALERARFSRRPSFALTERRHDANGYQGLHLLDFREHQAALALQAGEAGGVTVHGAGLEAAGSGVRRTGSGGGVSFATRLGDRFFLGSRADWWRFRGTAGSAAGLLQAGWRPADYWTMTAGVERERVLENMATIDRGLAASGVFAAADRRAPRSSLAVRLAWQRLSDGNDRQRALMSGSRTLWHPQLQALVWIEHLGYRRATADYFSPDGFTRADLGVAYTYRFAMPRFRHDRHQEISAAYLIGTDSRGERYLHPSIRLSVEIVRGLALDARADAISSDVYDGRSFSIGLRLGGSGRGEPSGARE